MNVLLIDHACHKRTGSFAFLRRLLSGPFTTDVLYYGEHGKCIIPKGKVQWADWIVFLEFLPWRFRLGVPGKKCLFVPMYDNEWGSVWQWRRIARSQMYVLSFSSHVTEHALRCGVDPMRLVDARFAPDPSRYAGMRGDSRKLLLWERGEVSFETAKGLFAPEDLDKVLVLRHPEELASHPEISEADRARYKVVLKEAGFLPEKEYRNLIAEYGLVLAPRFKEGIGMAFLEAMAMGKVVIAHNDATMNEVIQHGENGWLADLRHPARLDASALRRLHKCGFDRTAAYQRWRKDAGRILDLLASADCTPMKSASTWPQAVRYVRYLFEGLSMRLKPTR